MRKPVDEIACQARIVHYADDFLLQTVVVFPEHLVGNHTLGNNLPDRHPGIQGGVGILEDHLEIAAQEPDFIVVQPGQVDPVIQVFLCFPEFLVVRILFRFLADLCAGILQFRPDPFDGRQVCIHGSLQFVDLFLQGTRIPACFLRAVQREFRVLQAQLQVCQLFFRCMLLPCFPVQFPEHFLYRFEIFQRHKAADQVRHVQESVVRLLFRRRQFIGLGILLRAVLHRFVLFAEIVPGFLVAFQVLFQLVQVFESRPHVFRRDVVQRPAVVHGTSVCLAVKLQQRPAERAFSASGLAHQAQGFAFVDIERDPVVGFHVKAFFLQREILFQIADPKQRLFTCCLHDAPPFSDRSSEPAGPE